MEEQDNLAPNRSWREGSRWPVYKKCVPLLVASLCFLGLIFGFTDTDIVFVFRSVLERSVAIIPANRQFLFEAILPNYVGAGLSALIEDNTAVAIGWLLVGAGTFAYILFLLLFRKLIDWKTIFLLGFFSPILKICVSWIGKSDPYLLAFLLLPAFSQSNSLLVFLSSALAALCHAQIAVVSLVLLECARFMLLKSLRYSAVSGAIVGLVIARVYSSTSGGSSGRLDYMSRFLPDLVLSGAFNAFSFAVMSTAPLMILFLASGVMKPLELRQLARLNVFPFVVCLSSITLVSIFLTFDRSRVFALATFPTVAFVLHTFREQLFGFFLRRTLLCSLIALLILATPQLGATDWIVSTSVARRVINSIGSTTMKDHLQCQANCNIRFLE